MRGVPIVVNLIYRLIMSTFY